MRLSSLVVVGDRFRCGKSVDSIVTLSGCNTLLLVLLEIKLVSAVVTQLSMLLAVDAGWCMRVLFSVAVGEVSDLCFLFFDGALTHT